MQLVLVRHGEPAWTEGGLNRDDPRLTFRGRQQALLVAAQLAEQTFDHVWVSPKRRAIETAKPYLDLTGLAGENHDFLAEIGNPDWEGTDHNALDFFAALRRRDPAAQWDGLDGGEAVTDFHERVTSGLDAALGKRGVSRTENELPTWQITDPVSEPRVLVFAHAGTNSCIVAHLLGVSPVPWEWERFVTRHASITAVEPIPIGDAYAFSMRKLSETRHLPDHLLTM